MINVYVVSGFLGAGKTTFIQKLLNEKKFEKVMLLENEFGEVGVDSAFFDKSLNVKEINNGCICCSLQGDFADALEEIEDMGISDLIIEPSGVGKLSEIITVIKQDSDFRIVSHICIVDVKTCRKYHLNFKEYFDNQVKCANAIILSHTDVADKETIDKAIEVVKEVNDDCTIVTKPVSEMNIDELLDIIVSGGDILPEIEEECCCGHHHHHHNEECCCGHHHDDDDDNDEECECHHHHEHDEHHHHHHDDDTFKSIVLRPSHIFTKEELELIAKKIPDDIIRVKGYVKGEKGTLYFNYVLNESNIYEGVNRNDSLIVVIGTEINETFFKGLFNE